MSQSNGKVQIIVNDYNSNNTKLAIRIANADGISRKINYNSSGLWLLLLLLYFALCVSVCVCVQAVHLDRMLTFRFHYANKMLSASAADDAYRLSLTDASARQQQQQ